MQIDAEDLLDLIDTDYIYDYLGRQKTSGEDPNAKFIELPSARELLLIYYREGAEGINGLVHREIHRVTGVDTNG